MRTITHKSSLGVLLVLLLASLSSAQVPVEQVTLVRAKAAEVVQEKDTVLIIAKELELKPLYAIRLVIPDTKYIQVYNIVTINGQSFASFPPKIYEPNPNYLILGKPGDKLGISIPNSNGPPIYQEATIAPSITPPPPTPEDPPPPSGFDDLKRISKEEADKVNDPQTRTKLIEAYNSVLVPGKSWDQLRADLTTARQLVLNSRPTPVKTNWEPWKKAIEAELLRTVPNGNVEVYYEAFQVVVQGLRQ